MCWSPDGRTIASGSADAFKLWDTATGQLLHTLSGAAYNPTWSPDGKIAFSKGHTIEIRDAQTGQLLQMLRDPGITSVFASQAWSPTNPAWLASWRNDYAVQLWDTTTGQLLYTIGEFISLRTLPGNIAWSVGGRLLAWGNNSTIQFWDTGTRQLVGNLEGHTATVTGIAFSSDGNFLASQSWDSTVRLWYSVNMETVAEFPAPPGDLPPLKKSVLAFSPGAPVLAYVAGDDLTIHIVDLDFATILNTSPDTHSVHYTNAKVVLLGDSGVGKSGLGLVLSRQSFVPTESTHGRNVWTFDSRDVELDGGRKETRETLLWDLAGQPGYRLIHQLHLNEVAAALVVFDARSETDPFAGVYHWNRALEQAQRVQGNSALPMKKFLVASRMDRGGVGVSRDRINSLLRELGFDGYFETSAKAEWGIEELKKAIRGAIQWDKLPWVSSTDLFQRIKDFLVAEKEAERLQSTSSDLYRAFLQSDTTLMKIDSLQAQFETFIGRVESRGLIRRLSFGNLVLLQPELLDAYASALINAVKEEPDGLGSIAQERVLTGNFIMPENERIKDREQEKLLLIAMVEDLLRYEIALREQADEGPYLIFPSQSTRENPDLPEGGLRS